MSWKDEVGRELKEARVALFYMFIGLMLGWSIIVDAMNGDTSWGRFIYHLVWFAVASHIGVVIVTVKAAWRGLRNWRARS